MLASQVRGVQIPLSAGKPRLLPLCEFLKGKTSRCTGIEMGMIHSPQQDLFNQGRHLPIVQGGWVCIRAEWLQSILQSWILVFFTLSVEEQGKQSHQASKGPEGTFFSKDIQMANRYMKVFNNTNCQGNTNQNHSEISFTPVRMTYIKKISVGQVVG